MTAVATRRAKDADVTAIADIHVRSWQAAYRGALMTAALGELERLGWREVVLWVLPENRPALAFYDRFGLAVEQGVEKLEERSGRAVVRLRASAIGECATDDWTIRGATQADVEPVLALWRRADGPTTETDDESALVSLLARDSEALIRAGEERLRALGARRLTAIVLSDAVLVPPYRSRRVLDALPGMSRLRLVQALESGVEWLLPHIPDGVTVCNSRGAHDAAVAEWVVGAVLAMQRKLPEHLNAQRQGLWRNIVARGEWRPPFAGDLVVIVLAPLTPDTEGLVDADLIGAMKPGALLVNAGRGRLVDQEALTEALYDGRIRAALDVTDPEPLPTGDRLWSAPNLLLTPHMAGDTPRRYRRSWEMVGEQVERLLDGRPLENVVKR